MKVIAVEPTGSPVIPQKLHGEEGVMVGVSSGAVAFAAFQVANRSESAGKRVVGSAPFGRRARLWIAVHSRNSGDDPSR